MKPSTHKILAVVVYALFALSLAACESYEARKQAYYNKGKQLLEAGDRERARLELKNALQIDNKHADSWYLLGRIEEQDREFAKAFGNYSRAVELDPAQVEARVRKALLLLLFNQIDDAAVEIETALASRPEDADALSARATLKSKQGNKEGAENDALAALRIDPANLGAALFLASLRAEQGRFEAAVGILRKTIELNPDDPAPRLVLGSIYDAIGEVEKAIESLRQLAQKNPREFAFKARLANYYVERGFADKAEAVLREALAEAPDDIQRQRALLSLISSQQGSEAAETELATMIARQPDSAPLRFFEAGLQLKKGETDSAIETFERIIESADGIGPDAIRARNAVAEILLKTDRETEAAALIETTLEEASLDPDALLLRAIIALRKSEYEQAIGDLRALLRERPDRDVGWRLLGQAHVALGENELAREAFEKATALNPQDVHSRVLLARLKLRAGDAEGAKTTLETLADESPENLAIQQSLAQIHIARRDWDALSESGAQMSRHSPEHPMGAYIEGLALQQKERHAEAIEAFEKSLELRPAAAEPLVALVRSHAARGSTDQAELRVRRLLKEFPGHPVALTLMSELALAKGDSRRARQYLERAVKANDRNPQPYIRLARLDSANQELGRARQVLQQGLDATGGHASLQIELATLAQNQGDYAAAIAAYEKVVDRHPGSQVSINNLAMLLVDHGGGREALERAMKLVDPLKQSTQPLFIDTVGWIYHKNGKYQEAGEFLEKANDMRRGVAEIEYHLGMNYLKLGRLDEAREFLDAAIDGENFRFRAEAEAALASIGQGG